MISKIIKWVSLPALLIGSLFTPFAASYQHLLEVVICLGAIIVVQRAVTVKKYFWAAGFVAIAIVFSPLMLVFKVFLLMGFLCMATFVTLLATWKTQPVPLA